MSHTYEADLQFYPTPLLTDFKESNGVNVVGLIVDKRLIVLSSTGFSTFPVELDILPNTAGCSYITESLLLFVPNEVENTRTLYQRYDMPTGRILNGVAPPPGILPKRRLINPLSSRKDVSFQVTTLYTPESQHLLLLDHVCSEAQLFPIDIPAPGPQSLVNTDYTIVTASLLTIKTWDIRNMSKCVGYGEIPTNGDLPSIALLEYIGNGRLLASIDGKNRTTSAEVIVAPPQRKNDTHFIKSEYKDALYSSDQTLWLGSDDVIIRDTFELDLLDRLWVCNMQRNWGQRGAYFTIHIPMGFLNESYSRDRRIQ